MVVMRSGSRVDWAAISSSDAGIGSYGVLCLHVPTPVLSNSMLYVVPISSSRMISTYTCGIIGCTRECRHRREKSVVQVRWCWCCYY